MQDIILNWYDDADISTLIDAKIKGMGGYKTNSNFLLTGIGDGKFPDDDAKRYVVLVTPAIDISEKALPIDYFFDKTKQQRNSLASLLEKLIPQFDSIKQHRSSESEVKDLLQRILASDISTTDKGHTINKIYAELDELNYELEKVHQRIKRLDNQLTEKKDVFDEMVNLLQPASGDIDIKILFPYNITFLHWLTGEIKIHKVGNIYKIEITAHDPKGEGEIGAVNFSALCATLERKIKAIDPTAIVKFESYISAYLPRQARDDDNACGVIVVNDLVKRITGASLFQQNPYPAGAKELRQEHIDLIKHVFNDATNPTRISFLTNRQRPVATYTKPISIPTLPISAPYAQSVANKPTPITQPTTTGGVYDPSTGKIISYKELELSTNRLGNFLKKQLPTAVKTIQHVAVFMPQSLEYWQCFYALHKADMVAMPISPFSDAPADRLANFLEGGAITAIISLSRFKKHPFFSTPQVQKLIANKAMIFLDEEQLAIDSCDNSAPMTTHTLTDLAYIVNTSGSTSKPKQVMVSHQGIPLCTQGHIDTLQITEKDNIAGFADVMFDAHIVEMDMAKKSGANFYILPEEYRRDLTKLAKFYQSNHITVGVFVASMLRQYKKSDFPDLRVVICTGEKIDDAIIREWGDKVILIDGYGPAENTIATWLKRFYIKSTGDKLEYSVKMALIPETECFVLQFEPEVPGQPLKRMKDGEEGELYLAGKSVALGYSDPKLTSDRFKIIPHPDDNNRSIRVYQTRDVARRNLDGSYDITGRLDRQIKVYGKLLCPEEIEEIFKSKYQNIFAKIHVDAKIHDRGHPELVLYYELSDGQQSPPLKELAEAISSILGQTFVPTAWVNVGKFPTLDSGKIDTKKVPTLTNLVVERIHGGSNIEPQTPLEKELAAIFMQVLIIPEKNFVLQRDDNFFELGGKSLQATVLLQILRRQYNLKLTYDEFKLISTVELLGRAIHRIQQKTEIVPVISIYEERTLTENAPVFFLPSLIGDVEKDTEKLKRQWRHQRSIYGFSARGYKDPADMDNDLMVIAYDYYRAIKAKCPHGPKILAGWSLGGILALLVKHYFTLEGDEDVAVMMVDSESPTIFQNYTSRDYAKYLQDLFEKKLGGLMDIKQLPLSVEVLANLPKDQQIYQLFSALEGQLREPGLADKKGLLATVRGSLLGVLKVKFTHTIDNVTLITASETKAKHTSDRLQWPTIIEIKKDSPVITASHDSIMLEDTNAKRVAECLEQLSMQHQNNFMSSRLADKLLTHPSPDIDADELKYYIALNACRNNMQNNSFPLMAEVNKDFLSNKDRKCLLIIGPVAAGKTMFLWSLAEHLRKQHKAEDPVVLYIPCAAYEDPHVNLVEKHLRRMGYTDAQIIYMKKHQRFTIIIDGREEILGKARYQNIYMTNKISEWNAQVIMGIRDSFFFEAQDKTIFYPSMNNKPMEFYLVPFKIEQIREYIHTFLADPPEEYIEVIKSKLFEYLSVKYPEESETELEKRVAAHLLDWLKPETYLGHIDALPGIQKVISTPFLLRVFMEICIDIVFQNEDKPFEERVPETEAHALDLFIEDLWNREAFKLMGNPDIELPPDDIRNHFEDFCLRLAMRMKLAKVTQITYKPGTNSPWEEFFNSKAETVLNRRGAPLKRLTEGTTVARPMARRARYNMENVNPGEVIGFLHPIFIDHLSSRAVFNNHPEAMNASFMAEQVASEVADAEPPPPQTPTFTPNSTTPVTTFFAKPAPQVTPPISKPAAVSVAATTAEEEDPELAAAIALSMEAGGTQPRT